MGRIRRVLSDQLWHEVRTLLVDGLRDAAWLLAYLTTNPGLDFTGLGIFNASGIAEDIALSTRRVRTALQGLAARGLVEYEERTRIVFVPMILEGDPIRSSAQLAGALRRLEGMPSSPLVDRVRIICGQGVRESPRESPGESPGESPLHTPTPSPSPSPTLSPAPSPSPAPRASALNSSSEHITISEDERERNLARLAAESRRLATRRSMPS